MWTRSRRAIAKRSVENGSPAHCRLVFAARRGCRTEGGFPVSSLTTWSAVGETMRTTQTTRTTASIHEGGPARVSPPVWFGTAFAKSPGSREPLHRGAARLQDRRWISSLLPHDVLTSIRSRRTTPKISGTVIEAAQQEEVPRVELVVCPRYRGRRAAQSSEVAALVRSARAGLAP
jgi:hypothetical protein